MTAGFLNSTSSPLIFNENGLKRFTGSYFGAKLQLLLLITAISGRIFDSGDNVQLTGSSRCIRVFSSLPDSFDLVFEPLARRLRELELVLIRTVSVAEESLTTGDSTVTRRLSLLSPLSPQPESFKPSSDIVSRTTAIATLTTT